jgi:OOP family OmpA-OmpF porin
MMMRATLAAALLLVAGSALATDETLYPAYLRATDGSVVHNNFGECWGLGANHVTATPTPECDPAAPVPAPVAMPAPTPAPEPGPAPAPTPTHMTITLSADALFDFDKSAVKPEGRATIDSELNQTNLGAGAVGVTHVTVVGHTDSVGSAAYNAKLSLRRANAVKAYLVTKGVPVKLISVEGHGLREPVASNDTAEGRAQNRRAEISIDTDQ